MFAESVMIFLLSGLENVSTDKESPPEHTLINFYLTQQVH